MSDRKDSEFFADGITEEIINALTRIHDLKVTSRTSSFYYKGKNNPIPSIAKELGVTLILEGSIRFGGNKVRITAQLIQAEDDFHFFSETWDRELDDIFQVQDEISLLIADKIRENFGHFEMQDHLVKKQTENMSAYEYSLMAKFYKNKWNPDDAKIAQEYFEKSLTLDPLHVESIVGLADVYSFLGMTGALSFQDAWLKCNELIDKALELDPQNPEAFYQKGHSAFFTECDFSKALDYAEKTIQQKPNYAEAQQLMSFLLVLSGDKTGAKNHIDIALSIDPHNQETLFFKAYFDYMTGHFEDAYAQLSTCIAVNPKNIPAHAVMTLCLLKLGEYDKVIRYFDDIQVQLVEGEITGAIALAYANKNDSENTDKYFTLLQEQAKSPDGFTSDSYLFMMYAATGQIDKAFEWVESAIENKSTLLMLRYPDPIVDVLRQDKRYQKHFDQIFQIEQKEATKAEKKALLDDSSAEEYRLKLVSHLKRTEPYLDAGLTLRDLANQIDIHPNKLSWLINEMHEQNFNQFINNYRIEHFKKLAVNPENAQFSILGLAYDSGFNSKTVFNTYFKKSTGMSPKEWISTQ
ncbi:helix-turn-helix domain-containing protein [Paracrocinitomix mangrovi]|uniref:helix-turn-helix domain-containing protein n=1 Tax=Paracrocinitomix mangrovi TaxID=2862509 RepID=UPI001C8D90F7|nr:helix-turn-helix domain-containing protein [Paracrocinitomix mangrovi]UKN00455.1 helix-turn-helix domain-containing protein [Paracrocinitomix mangrovi]